MSYDVVRIFDNSMYGIGTDCPATTPNTDYVGEKYVRSAVKSADAIFVCDAEIDDETAGWSWIYEFETNHIRLIDSCGREVDWFESETKTDAETLAAMPMACITQMLTTWTEEVQLYYISDI